MSPLFRKHHFTFLWFTWISDGNERTEYVISVVDSLYQMHVADDDGIKYTIRRHFRVLSQWCDQVTVSDSEPDCCLDLKS